MHTKEVVLARVTPVANSTGSGKPEGNRMATMSVVYWKPELQEVARAEARIGKKTAGERMSLLSEGARHPTAWDTVVGAINSVRLRNEAMKLESALQEAFRDALLGILNDLVQASAADSWNLVLDHVLEGGKLENVARSAFLAVSSRAKSHPEVAEAFADSEFERLSGEKKEETLRSVFLLELSYGLLRRKDHSMVLDRRLALLTEIALQDQGQLTFYGSPMNETRVQLDNEQKLRLTRN